MTTFAPGDLMAWESYYRSLFPQGFLQPMKRDRWEDPDEQMRVRWVLERQKDRPVVDVWVPGCGLSSLPTLLAEVGLNVLATDASETAIAAQQYGLFDRAELRRDFAELFDATGAPQRKATHPQFRIHDARTTLAEAAFDLVLNVKSYQVFAPHDLIKVAQSHYTALRPGGAAYFETQNVSTADGRLMIEAPLADVGFWKPNFEIYRSYYTALRDSGIAHHFRLGRPMLHDDFWTRAQRDQQRILNEIYAAFEKKCKEAGWPSGPPNCRIAFHFWRSG